MFVSGACQNFCEPTQCFSGTGKYQKYCNETIISPAHVPWDEVKLLTEESKVGELVPVLKTNNKAFITTEYEVDFVPILYM